MKIFFKDMQVLLNGISVDNYYLDEGESTDVFILDSKIKSCLYLENGSPVCAGTYALRVEDVFYLFPENEREYTLYQYHSQFPYYLVSIFYDGRYCLVVENENDCAISTLEGKPVNVSCGTYGDTMAFYVKYYVGDVAYLRSFDLDIKEIGKIIAHTVEIDGNRINTFYRSQDLRRRSIRAEYAENAGKITKIEESIECARAQISTRELLPIQLLEAVACKDAQVSELLHDELKAHARDLFDYFGAVEEIRHLYGDVYAVKSGGVYKAYSFEIEGGLIVNVNEK